MSRGSALMFDVPPKRRPEANRRQDGRASRHPLQTHSHGCLRSGTAFPADPRREPAKAYARDIPRRTPGDFLHGAFAHDSRDDHRHAVTDRFHVGKKVARIEDGDAFAVQRKDGFAAISRRPTGSSPPIGSSRIRSSAFRRIVLRDAHALHQFPWNKSAGGGRSSPCPRAGAKAPTECGSPVPRPTGRSGGRRSASARGPSGNRAAVRARATEAPAAAEARGRKPVHQHLPESLRRRPVSTLIVVDLPAPVRTDEPVDHALRHRQAHALSAGRTSSGSPRGTSLKILYFNHCF